MTVYSLRSTVFGLALAVSAMGGARPVATTRTATSQAADFAALVNPLIGTAMGGNTFPGAVVPFGMVQWSPETTRGDHTRAAVPGGYRYDATRIRGFSLTHLSGTGCRGASGDVPFMPYVGDLTSSPSSDARDRVYASSFAHANEYARAGEYQVRLASGVQVELAATMRTGVGRFSYPAGKPATMLVRVSDSEVGSSDATVQVDSESQTITGSVTSGNFCGYLNAIDRRSYYTLYFVAVFDQPFVRSGTWQDETLTPDAARATGGTTYGTEGYPSPGRGSGAYVAFADGATVNVRVGISYVSLANAEANLRAESPEGTTLEATRESAAESWNHELGRIAIDGGTPAERTTFYTALYHALLHPNVFSDVNGAYRGFDGLVHHVSAGQQAQYANFSGWDVYRSQLQLVTLLEPGIGSDIAQSLFNQAQQNQGRWDRWTHNSGATHVMEGDPSPAAIAGIYAFGGTSFDAQDAYLSLRKAALEPTADDLSGSGCPIECAGQRPALDQGLSLNYIPAKAHAWGGAGETLEDAAADFSLARLAEQLDHASDVALFDARANNWKHLFNPQAAEGETQGFIQDRNADGTWAPFDAASSDGFAEGSSAQYTWMVPFDAAGLFALMGGNDRANARLDAFFHNADGTWALTGLGGLHAEMDNEPSIGAPWLYDFSDRPDRAQETVRAVVNKLWRDGPGGIPGNDDLGAMSAWYVWAALGCYPAVPGRAVLLLASPLFPHALITRANGVTLTIDAPQASPGSPYVTSLRVNGQPSTTSILPEDWIAHDGRLEFGLSAEPE